MRTVAVVLLPLVIGGAAPAWGQAQPAFPPACSAAHPAYVCVRLWNQLEAGTVRFLIDDVPQGSAGPGESVYTTGSPGAHRVEAIVVTDSTDQQRHTTKTVSWDPGVNATYCIYEPGHGGC